MKEKGEMPTVWDRRTILLGSFACIACDGFSSQDSRAAPVVRLDTPLGRSAPFPVGACVTMDQLDNFETGQLLLDQFSQITAERDMKMGLMLSSTGALTPGNADRLVEFARANTLAVHGHTLVWYHNIPPYFQRLASDKPGLARALQDYIVQVTSRYAGAVRGWDVVNEPMADDGQLRNCLWGDALGSEEYIVRAFEWAVQGDPKALLMLNDYDLERYPAKRAGFLKLAERLLKRGVKLGGLGTQSHINIDLPPAQFVQSLKDLASLGLPIHISEFDVSTARGITDVRSDSDKLALQAKIGGAVADAYCALPAAQRYGFTFWGLRDSDNWLNKPPMAGQRGGSEMPLPFDHQGQPKPLAEAVARAFQSARKG